MHRTIASRLKHSTPRVNSYVNINRSNRPEKYCVNTLLFPTSIPFAGADNAWCAPSANQIKAISLSEDNWRVPTTQLSFAHPESDWTAQWVKEHQPHNSSASTEVDHLSFVSTESDFCAPYQGELERADAQKNAFYALNITYTHLSFATPHADFTGKYPGESISTNITLTEALAPSTEARVLTSADGRFRIQHVNDAWTRLCGYSKSESCGKTLSILQGDATDEKVVEELVSLLRDGNSTEAVLVNYDKSGRKFRNHLTTTPVISSDSRKITHFLGVLRDIGDANPDELANAQKIIA